MTQFISTTLGILYLWILYKSGIESVRLASNDEFLRLNRYEKGGMSVSSGNLNAQLLANNYEMVSERSFGTDGSPKFLIEKFCTLFTNAILSSDQLSEMYDTSLSPEEAAKAYYRIVVNARFNVHAEFARASTLIVSSAILETFARLTLTKHVQAYGYSVAKFLVSMKILTHKNIRELCDCYISFNKAEAKYIPRIPDRRFAFFQAVSNSLLHFITSLGLYRSDTVELLSRDFAASLYKLTGIPSHPPKKQCSEDKVIDIFVDQLINLVSESPKLAELYDTSLSSEDAEKAYERIVYSAVAKVHTTDPMGVALNVSNAILDTFGSLNSTQHIQSHGYTAARYLKSMNVLTCENVHQLCDSYVAYIEEAFKNVPIVPDRRDAFIQGTADGFYNFMSSLNLYTGNSVVHFAQHFVSSLYAISGIPECTCPPKPPSCSGDDDSDF